MRRSPSCVPPDGVLEVGLTGDADGHRDGELGQSLAKLDGFLFVPAVEGFAQGERQFFGCTGSKGRVLIGVCSSSYWPHAAFLLSDGCHCLLHDVVRCPWISLLHFKAFMFSVTADTIIHSCIWLLGGTRGNCLSIPPIRNKLEWWHLFCTCPGEKHAKIGMKVTLWMYSPFLLLSN